MQFIVDKTHFCIDEIIKNFHLLRSFCKKLKNATPDQPDQNAKEM